MRPMEGHHHGGLRLAPGKFLLQPGETFLVASKGQFRIQHRGLDPAHVLLPDLDPPVVVQPGLGSLHDTGLALRTIEQEVRP